MQLDFGLSLPAKEGTDLTLMCEGRAKPNADNYRWYHNVSKWVTVIFLTQWVHLILLKRTLILYIIFEWFWNEIDSFFRVDLNSFDQETFRIIGRCHFMFWCFYHIFSKKFKETKFITIHNLWVRRSFVQMLSTNR